MDRLIMIKYGELTTKKANRKMFINMLENNINKILKNEKYEISKDRVRMYIKCDSSSLDSIVKKLKKVFGIHGIVIADKVNTNIDSITITIIGMVHRYLQELTLIYITIG